MAQKIGATFLPAGLQQISCFQQDQCVEGQYFGSTIDLGVVWAGCP